MKIYNLDVDKFTEEHCVLHTMEYLQKSLLIIVRYSHPGGEKPLEIRINVSHKLMTNKYFDLTTFLLNVVKEQADEIYKEEEEND